MAKAIEMLKIGIDQIEVLDKFNVTQSIISCLCTSKRPKTGRPSDSYSK